MIGLIAKQIALWKEIPVLHPCTKHICHSFDACGSWFLQMCMVGTLHTYHIGKSKQLQMQYLNRWHSESVDV